MSGKDELEEVVVRKRDVLEVLQEAIEDREMVGS